MLTQTLTPTTSRIISLFNHTLSNADRLKIHELFLKVECSNHFDGLAQGVLLTLSRKICKYKKPYCSIKQAMALAYAIDGRCLQVNLLDGGNDDQTQSQSAGDKKADISPMKWMPNPNGISKGDRVELVDTDSGELLCYTIVSQNETDIKSKKLAIDTPIASYLVGHIAGENVHILTPGGKRHFRINNVVR